MAGVEEQARRMMEAIGSFDDLKEIERCKSLIDSEEEEELVDAVLLEIEERVRERRKDGADDKVELPRWLVRTALRVWNYSKQDTIRVMTNFWSFRHSNAWPMVLKASEVEEELRSGVHWLLPGTDASGRGILVYNARFLFRGHACSVEGLQKMGSFLMQKAIEKENIVKNGIVCVLDLQGVDLSITTKFGIADVKRGILMWKDAFPCKLKKIYLVNMGIILSTIVAMAKSILSSKIRERVVLVDKTFQQLHADIDSSRLPPSLGGNFELDWESYIQFLLKDDQFNDS